MPRKSRIAFATLAAAVAIVAAFAASAYAVPDYGVKPIMSRTSGYYGREFSITPSIEGTQVLAGALIDVQTSWDGANWYPFAEGLKAEDPNELVDKGVPGVFDPMTIAVDDSLLTNNGFTGILPQTIHFRFIFEPADMAGKTKTDPTSSSYGSNFATSTVDAPFTILKNKKVHVDPSAPSSFKRKRYFTLAAQVSPDCGIGNVGVTIKRKAGGYKKSFNIETDDTGFASTRWKLSRTGTYTITYRWKGNAFGVASKSVTKTVRIK